jgi:hypothetical protein
VTDPSQALVESFRDAGIALLPPGEAFSKRIEGGLAELLEAINVENARVQETADRMLVNYDPAYADEMIVEWETAVGLVGSGTLAERQAALIARLRGRTSHAKRLFEDAALALGYGEETWIPLHLPLAKSTLPKFPDELRKGRFRFSFESLTSSSYSGQKQLYANPDFNTGIYLNGDGSFCGLRIVTESVNDSAGAITFTAGQRVTVDFDPITGVGSISGAATGNGPFALSTPPVGWSFGNTGALSIGYRHNTGDRPFDGYVGDFEYYSRTGIEFVTFPASVAGELIAGEPVYGDDLANVVRMYVPVDEQTADEALLEQFDYLRRAHGFFDIILEGPMGAERNAYKYFDRRTMAADDVVANLGSVSIRYQGFVSFQVYVDNGSAAAPSDSGIGVWELYYSTDGVRFSRLSNALVDAELAKIAVLSNTLVDATAIFTGVPGKFIKLRYNQTSGGAGNSRCDVYITTW